MTTRIAAATPYLRADLDALPAYRPGQAAPAAPAAGEEAARVR